MEKIFCFGLILGAVGGAWLVTNSNKARTLVRKGQEELKTKIDELMDEKLKNFENNQNSSNSRNQQSQN